MSVASPEKSVVNFVESIASVQRKQQNGLNRWAGTRQRVKTY